MLANLIEGRTKESNYKNYPHRPLVGWMVGQRRERETLNYIELFFFFFTQLVSRARLVKRSGREIELERDSTHTDTE